MSVIDPLTQVEIEAELSRLADRLGAETDRLAGLGLEAAKAEVRYKVARARSYLEARWPDTAPGSKPSEKPLVEVKTAEMMADFLSAEELKTRLVAQSAYDACRELCRTLRDQISAAQSVNTNIRSQT